MGWTWRAFHRLALVALGLICGCGPGNSSWPMYGIGEPLPHDPSVVLTEFSYTPAGPIQASDTLTFTARTNQSTDAGYVVAHVHDGSHFGRYALLYDGGIAPDAAAADGVWTGTLTWQADWPTPAAAKVHAELRWDDGYKSQVLYGPRITVEPDGKEV